METELLGELIGQKHDVLSQLRQLARRQSELIDEGDMGKLLGLLAAKQKLLSTLQTIERQLDPFRQQDPDSRQWRRPGDRQRAQQTAQRCETLLSEIMLVERQCETALVHRRDEAAARLQGAHDASQASRAYVQSSGPRRGQLDLSSET